LEFTVRTTDVRFLDVLRRYLGGFRTEEGPRDIIFSADCGVEKELVGGTAVRGKKRLFFQALLIFKGTGMEEMAGRLLSGARSWTNNQSNEFLRVRAGGVALDAGALLLPSQPEPHLATLVSQLVGRGAGYIGDEIVNLDPVMRRAHGTGLPLLVDAGDVPLLPIDAAAPRPRRGRTGQTRSHWPLLLEDLHGSPASPTDIRWIVFPTFRPGAATELREIGRADALFRFTQAGLNLHIWRDRALVLMQELLRSTFVAEVVIGDLSDGGASLLESLPERT
jgi:hypothetical protein